MKYRKWLSVLLTLFMMLSILPGTALTLSAADGELLVYIIDDTTNRFPANGSVTLTGYDYYPNAEYKYIVKKGDTVNIVVSPNEGYQMADLKVTYISSISGNDKNLAFDDETNSSFTVPTTGITKSITIHITFSRIESGHSISTLIAPGDETGNTISLDKDTAEAGDTVAVTLGIAPGTSLKILELYKTSDNTHSDVELTQTDAAHYTFIMPDYDVKIYVEFALHSYTVTVENTPSMIETGCTVEADTEEAHYGDTINITVTTKSYTQMEGIPAVTYTPDGQNFLQCGARRSWERALQLHNAGL